MKDLLLAVDYIDETGKFWSESCIKNNVFLVDETKNLHNQIAEILMEQDYMEMSYKNKPQGNIYRDDKNGNSKIVGYHYRTKCEIHDRDMPKAKMAYFTAWVSISEVKEFKLEDIEV